MARKFTFKKTIDLSSNKNEDQNTPALISSLTTAHNEVIIPTKKQPPPNIFQQQSISSSSTTCLPFKKQLPNTTNLNNVNNSSNKTISPTIVDKLSSKENNLSSLTPPSNTLNKPGKQVTLNRFFELKQQSPVDLLLNNQNSGKKPTATVVPQKQ